MPAIVSKMVQVHIARFQSDRIEYLLLQRADEETAYPGIWQVVTGGIEGGETAEDAARRELMEETGLIHQTMWAAPFVATFFDARHDAIHLVPVFAVIVSSEIEPRLSDEHKDFIWADYDEAQKRLVFPTHHEGTRIIRDYLLTADTMPFMKL